MGMCATQTKSVILEIALMASVEQIIAQLALLLLTAIEANSAPSLHVRGLNRLGKLVIQA